MPMMELFRPEPADKKVETIRFGDISHYLWLKEEKKRILANPKRKAILRQYKQGPFAGMWTLMVNRLVGLEELDQTS